MKDFFVLPVDKIARYYQPGTSLTRQRGFGRHKGGSTLAAGTFEALGHFGKSVRTLKNRTHPSFGRAEKW